MQMVKLTKDITVSKICFGSLTMAPEQANLTPERGGELLAYAFSKGINYVDTAQLYNNYPHIKEGLKRWGKNNIVISSKTYAYTKELAVEAVEGARKGMDRDIVDIFMLHEQESIHTLRGHKEALDYLLECKGRGIIKAVGVSMHHVAAVYGAMEIGGVDVVHPMLNYKGAGIVDGTRADMEIALIKAHDSGIGVVSMKPFGGGMLHTTPNECLDYLKNLPFVDVIAMGMQSEDEIDANISFFQNGEFSQGQINKLKQKKRKLMVMDWCIGCGACEKKCSQQAISIIDKVATVRPERCILCGYCGMACKESAIKIV